MVAKPKAPNAASSLTRPSYWDDPMTPKQQAIFQFVRKFFQNHEHGPTAVEVATSLAHLSESAVRYNLKALERIDYLRRVKESGITRWSPTGRRALDEAHLWRMVDQGLGHWAGGKPKGSRRPIKVIGEGYVSDFVHEDRR
jgi:SOS-response transcriptional repressor LexA